MANKYLKFEYWNTCDLGKIYYQGGQKFTFYLDGDALEPFYEEVEDGQENGDGDFIPTYRRQIKKYIIRTSLIPDYLFDAIKRMELHDNIELTWKSGEVEQIYNVQAEIEWQFEKYCWQGVATITFDMDEKITVGACCDNLTVGEVVPPEPIPDLYWVAETGSDVSGDGTYANPWATLGYATTQATTSGDIIHVKAGTITETVQSVLAVGVSIVGSGDTSIITSTAALNPIILLSSATEGTDGNQSISYIQVDGDSTALIGITVIARKNIKIHHCTFRDFLTNGVRFTGVVSGNNPPTIYALNNEVYNCFFYDCGNEVFSDPYYFASSALTIGGQKDMLIHDNYINETGGKYGYGISSTALGYNMGLDIYNNTILVSPKHQASNQWSFATELWNNKGGIKIHDNIIQGGVDHGGLGSDDIGGYGFALKVYDNEITMDALQPYDQQAILLESDMDGGVYIYGNWIENYSIGLSMNALSGPTDIIDSVFIYYNIFIETHKSSGNYSGRAISVGTGDYTNISIDNNVVYNSAYIGSAGFHFSTAGSTFTDLNIRNNIFVKAYNAIRFEDNTITNVNITNNQFYLHTTTTSYVNVTDTNVTEEDPARTGDPLFVSATDFHLQAGSPCINAGVALELVFITIDYEGTAIGIPDPNIGAYE